MRPRHLHLRGFPKGGFSSPLERTSAALRMQISVFLVALARWFRSPGLVKTVALKVKGWTVCPGGGNQIHKNGSCHPETNLAIKTEAA